MEAVVAAPKSPSIFATFAALSRLHILAIASFACLVFGWLLTGSWLAAAAVLCCVDWFIVNLVNRVADLAEDRENGIVGTDLISAHGRLFELGCGALLVGSLVGVHLVAPQLTVYRVCFHAIGLAYNYKLLPTPKGRTRFKETYFFKNFSSAVLFVLSTMLYPLALAKAPVQPLYLALLVGFFLPLEMTYEVIYDLRDVKGDAKEKVPTFPVVHSVATSHRIIDGLIILSAASLLAGGVLGVFKLRELVLIAAPIQQALYFHFRLKRAPTPDKCIFITWLGAAQVLSYVIWVNAGLPVSF
ncbi:MAG: UbiA family prenyltransferase [Myxococcaceae bacterium]